MPTEPREIDEAPPSPQPRRFDENGDASRRTWLASERTVLAWLRTGLTATAVALAVGKVVPDLRDGGSSWPFVVLGAEYNQGFARPQAIGAGFGLSFRYWFRADYYAAPRSYFDLGLQYRFRLSGDDRAGGLILRATVTY